MCSKHPIPRIQCRVKVNYKLNRLRIQCKLRIPVARLVPIHSVPSLSCDFIPSWVRPATATSPSAIPIRPMSALRFHSVLDQPRDCNPPQLLPSAASWTTPTFYPKTLFFGEGCRNCCLHKSTQVHTSRKRYAQITRRLNGV